MTSQVEFDPGDLLRGRRSRPGRACGSRSTASIASTPRELARFRAEGEVGEFDDELIESGEAQGEHAWSRLARPHGDLEQGHEVRLRAAERGPGRPGTVRPAAGLAGRPALGDAGHQPVHGQDRRRSGSRSCGGRRSTGTPNPVNAFEVVQKMSGAAQKTWVRTDGLVLRQEVPFPFVKTAAGAASGGRRPDDRPVAIPSATIPAGGRAS